MADQVTQVSDPSLDNLQKINHIGVLMLENRSFDHMLGYLTLEAGRSDVEGLKKQMSNTLTELCEGIPQGTEFPVEHLRDTIFENDPFHDHEDVKLQIAPPRDMSGFVDDFARVLKQRKVPGGPGSVMGYYNAADLPVYDFLANAFCICDHWFSSFPGPTWANRTFATAGQSFGETDNTMPVRRGTPLSAPIGPGVPTFFRELDDHEPPVPWKWYAHDVSTLRLIDGKYTSGHGQHFAFISEFFKDARDGKLPSVLWIDPNFVDFGDLVDRRPDPAFDYGVFPTEASDDHPPTDVRHAQQLVLEIYAALISSPLWSKTLFITVYDEHGGFFDHVTAPKTGDDPPFDFYGVRVPALVISPFVKRSSVSPTVFDHTSIIRTVLERFCRRQDGSIPARSNRVAKANHLGELLTEPVARTDTTCGVANTATHRFLRSYTGAALKTNEARRADLRKLGKLTDLQQELLAAKELLRSQGLLTIPLSISLSPSSLALGSRSTATVEVSITGQLDFAVRLNLRLLSPNPGITGSFSINPAISNSILTLNVAGSVPPGNYDLTVQGTSGNMTTGNTLKLTVKPFILSLSEPDVSLLPGAPAQALTVTITRAAGFTAGVDLSLVGIPSGAGIGHRFSPDPATGSTSTLSLTASRFATPGGFQLTVRGASGTQVETVPLIVEVLESGLP